MREVGNSEERSERINKHRYEKRTSKNKEGTRDEVQQRARKRLPKKRMHEERGGR